MITNVRNKKYGLWNISIISMLSVLLFAELITINYFSSQTYTLLQYLMAIPILIYCIKNIHILFNTHISIVMFLCILILGISIVVSSYINDVTAYNLRNAIYFAVLLCVMDMFVTIVGYKKKLDLLLNAGKIYLLFILIANDLLMFVLPDKFYNIAGREIGTCLIGNKFVVAYAHMTLLFLLVILYKGEKYAMYRITIYGIITMLICLYVDCMTAVLGTAIFLILYFLPKHIKPLLSSPIVFSAAFFGGAFLLILFDKVLSFGPIQFLIVDVLHRDLTLTGRMEIYYFIFKLLATHKWFGYGYGTNIVETTSIWYANAQNAFWDFAICYGFIALALLFLFLVIVICKCNKVQSLFGMSKYTYVCTCMLYIYIFMGIGEIVYNKLFIFYAVLLGAACIQLCSFKNKSVRNLVLPQKKSKYIQRNEIYFL